VKIIFNSNLKECTALNTPNQFEKFRVEKDDFTSPQKCVTLPLKWSGEWVKSKAKIPSSSYCAQGDLKVRKQVTNNFTHMFP